MGGQKTPIVKSDKLDNIESSNTTSSKSILSLISISITSYSFLYSRFSYIIQNKLSLEEISRSFNCLQFPRSRLRRG